MLFLHKNICCGCSIELLLLMSTHNMFIKENCRKLSFIIKYPPYLFFWWLRLMLPFVPNIVFVFITKSQVTPILTVEQIIWVFGDNKHNFRQFSIKTYVVGTYNHQISTLSVPLSWGRRQLLHCVAVWILLTCDTESRIFHGCFYVDRKLNPKGHCSSDRSANK